MFGMGTGDPLRLVTGMVKDFSFWGSFFFFSCLSSLVFLCLLKKDFFSLPLFLTAPLLLYLQNRIIQLSLLVFSLLALFFIRSSTLERFSLFGQALGLLVSVSLIHYCTYTSDLSNT